jgi:hypothetical protein
MSFGVINPGFAEGDLIERHLELFPWSALYHVLMLNTRTDLDTLHTQKD